MNSRGLTLTRNPRVKCPLRGLLLKSICKYSCIQIGIAPFEETQIHENGIEEKKKNRYIGRNYSHYKRIICFTKGVTAGFLLNSSLKAFKTGSDLHSFSRMLLCKERRTCYGSRNSFAGLVFFFFCILSYYLCREISFSVENGVTQIFLNSYLCLYV